MKKMMICLTALIMLMGCTSLAENKAATEYTAKANAAWYDMLDFSDETAGGRDSCLERKRL